MVPHTGCQQAKRRNAYQGVDGGKGLIQGHNVGFFRSVKRSVAMDVLVGHLQVSRQKLNIYIYIYICCQLEAVLTCDRIFRFKLVR